MADTEVQPRLTTQLPVGRARLQGHGGATADDARLVAGVRAGDAGALEAIFDRYGPALLSFCRHMLGSREDAEDALQHVMLSAHRALVRSGDEIHLRAWLFAIARNRCRSMLRARRTEVPLDDAPVATDGLAAEVERREDLRAMLRDLRRLPEDQRAALLLAELGAHSHQEIATVIGVRPSKVKALVFQAREALAAARTARETPCAEIREQLATLRGSALRRGLLRRHVEHCPGCRAFEAEVARQRAAFAVLLPMAPGAALKSSVLGAAAVGAGGAAAGGVATGGLLAVAQGGAVKLLVAAAVVGAAGGGGYVAITDHQRDQPAAAQAAPTPRAGGERVLVTPAANGLAPIVVFGSPAAAPVAPGHTKPGATGVAPGHAKRQRSGAPGASGVAPGHTKRPSSASPGASGAAPGHTKRPTPGAPGASGVAPGHTKRPSTGSAGNSGAAPGHAKRSASTAAPGGTTRGSSGPASGHVSRGQGGTAGSRRPQPAPAPASGRSAGPAAGRKGGAPGHVADPPPTSKRSDPAGAPLADAPADHSGSEGQVPADPSVAPRERHERGRASRS